jgi:monofunctional biosynthetic peptidoglycan transglycosylase
VIWSLKLAGSFLLLTVGLVILYRFIDPPLTPLMLIRPIEAVAAGQVTAIDKKWTDIDDVSPALLRSVIAAEDARFFTHNGVDWQAVEDARKYNERTKSEKIRGASTITMQCARNVFLWQGRNYIRKGLEAYFTYLMETFWSKRRILEVYVNVIEWGDGFYGVGAASEHYFGVPAAKLTARQAALLASVLPNPRRYNAGAPDGYIGRRSARIQSEAPIVSLAPLELGVSAASKKKN